MSLLERVEKLEQNSRDEVVSALTSKYGNSPEFQSYMYLAPGIENQPWDDASDGNSGQHIMKAKTLMDEMLSQLQQKKQQLSQGMDLQALMLAKKVEETHNYLQQNYGENPVGFVNAIQEILSTLTKVIEEKTVSNLPQTPPVDEDAAMESDQTAAPTKEELILQELNRLMAESQANEQLVKDLEQLKETYVFRFQEISTEIGNIERAVTNVSQHPSMNPNEKRQNLLKLEEKKNALRLELSKRGEELLVTKRTLVINKLGLHLQKASNVQTAILDDIHQWRWEQQRSLCGWPQPPPLDGLQKLCEMLGEILWRLYQGIMQMDSIFRPVIQNEAEVKRMDDFQNGIKTLLEVFLRKTFIIEKQPPQVLKKVTKFGARLRLLVGGKNLKIHPPEVTCTVVTEKDINRYNLFGNRDKSKSGALPNNKNVLNNKKTMEYDQETNVLDVEFKNLSLTAADRQGGKNKDAVTDEKSCVLFSATLNLGKETFQVFAVSAPVCLTVHGNQAPDAEATIFWDNAFASKGRKALEVPEEVPWPRMAEAISNRWKLWNEVGLTQDHLLYLANKIFPGTTADELANVVVTKHLFNKDHLQGRQFTFWQWLFGAMDVVKRNLLNEWKDGNVIGFISKQQSHDQLIQRIPGTFLIRFSDGELGGVTVPYCTHCASGHIAVWNLKPWTNRDFGMRKLSDRIKDIDELAYLYPDQKHKKLAFGNYYTREDLPQQDETNPGYIDTVLATRVKGSTPGGPMASPAGSNFGQFDSMDPGQFPMFSMASPGSPQSSVVFDTDLGGEETIGDPGANGEEMALAAVFLNGLQGTGPNSYSDLAALTLSTSKPSY